MQKHYIPLGRGKVLFQKASTTGFHDFGNVTEFGVTLATEKKEHYSSRSGLKVKDDEMIMSMDASFSFTADSLSKKNLELFNMGTTTDVTQTSGTLTSASVTVSPGLWFSIGYSNLSNVVVKNTGGTTTYVEGTDYELDLRAGMIYILETGSIPAGDIAVSGDYAAASDSRIDAGTLTEISGTLKFVSDFPSGSQMDVSGDVKISPSGNMSLIGDDYLTIGFEGTFTKPATASYLYQLFIRG